jgi:hypothetical protein
MRPAVAAALLNGALVAASGPVLAHHSFAINLRDGTAIASRP